MVKYSQQKSGRRQGIRLVCLIGLSFIFIGKGNSAGIPFVMRTLRFKGAQFKFRNQKGEDGMAEEMMKDSYDGIPLFFRKDEVRDPRAVILIVHGLCEHLGRYDYTTARLNEYGYSVYRFDHRGHGRSKGKRVFYSDFNQMIEDVNTFAELAKEENPGVPVFILGHSMGGYAAACFGTRYPRKVRGIILSGGLTRYNTQCAGPLPIDDAPVDTYVPNELGDIVCSDKAVIEAYAKDLLVEKEISVGLLNSIYEGIEWLKAHPQDFTYPVLLLHGACDGLVAEKDSRDFFGDIASGDKSLIIYAKLFHEILNEPCKDEVISDITKWIDKRI